MSQRLHLRPRNRFEEFDRMYLVGGGTHPGSGLPVIFESARISSKLLLDDLGVSNSPVEPPSRREQPGPGTSVTARSGKAMADAVQTFARLLNLKTAPIANERVADRRHES